MAPPKRAGGQSGGSAAFDARAAWKRYQEGSKDAVLSLCKEQINRENPGPLLVLSRILIQEVVAQRAIPDDKKQLRELMPQLEQWVRQNPKGSMGACYAFAAAACLEHNKQWEKAKQLCAEVDARFKEKKDDAFFGPDVEVFDDDWASTLKIQGGTLVMLAVAINRISKLPGVPKPQDAFKELFAAGSSGEVSLSCAAMRLLWVGVMGGPASGGCPRQSGAVGCGSLAAHACRWFRPLTASQRARGARRAARRVAPCWRCKPLAHPTSPSSPAQLRW